MKLLLVISIICALSGCCPQAHNQSLAEKCAAKPSCKAALDKLSKDVQ